LHNIKLLCDELTQNLYKPISKINSKLTETSS